MKQRPQANKDYYQEEYYKNFEIPAASQGQDLAWARFEHPDMLSQPFTTQRQNTDEKDATVSHL